MSDYSSNNTKIALFLPSLAGGGAEKVFVTLANEFAQRGIEIQLVLAKKEGPYLKNVSDKVKIVDLNTHSVFALFPLVRYLRKERPDVLLSSMEHANIVAILASKLARAKTRIIVRTANTISLSVTQAKRGRALVSKHGAMLLYRFAEGIIVNSKGSADDLAKTLKISRGKVTVIYNPLDIQSITEQAKESVEHKWLTHLPAPSEARQAGKEAPVIISVGRLRKHKDFATLIRAFSYLNRHSNILQNVRMSDTKLIILGEGPDREDLEALIKELKLEDSVSLPGFVENPYAYMARADVFALPSRWEGLPNVLLEAMAVGTPVVSTDCPSGPREILQDGKYSKLVPVGDPEALAEAIEETLQNPTDPELLKSRASDFRLEKIADEYLTFLLK